MTIVEQLHNKKVITKDEIEVGSISGAVMDDQWRITHLHLALNNETTHKLKYIKPMMGHVNLCLPVHIIENKNEAIYLTKTLEEIKILPGCKTH
ncbi:MAG: hypothetical protein AC479_02220 [miscellaneous Crenarchaeota group-6 archaeon AD8-1]|nr:MAG: hypothetical protein AC479_02220 [miscellaneous Crenarchaeota group-6 archaeon AD8-1]